MKKNKYLIPIALVILIVGYVVISNNKNTNPEIQTFYGTIEKDDPTTVIENNDLTIKVKINDDLSSSNSYITKDENQMIVDFYSVRNATVLKTINGDYKEGSEIRISEPIAYDENNNKIYESIPGGYTNSLKKGEVYTVFVSKVDNKDFYSISGEGTSFIKYDKDGIPIEATNNEDFALIAQINILSLDSNFDLASVIKNATEAPISEFKDMKIIDIKSDNGETAEVSYRYIPEDKVTYFEVYNQSYTVPGMPFE